MSEQAFSERSSDPDYHWPPWPGGEDPSWVQRWGKGRGGGGGGGHCPVCRSSQDPDAGVVHAGSGNAKICRHLSDCLPLRLEHKLLAVAAARASFLLELHVGVAWWLQC